MTTPKLVLLTPAEAGAVLGITSDAVRKLHNTGKIEALVTRTGRRLFLERDVLVLAKKRAEGRR